MAEPISISLVCNRPTFVAGQEPPIVLQIQANANIQLESVELNRNRTTIRIAPAVGEPFTLTGQDYVAQQQQHPLKEVAAAFTAVAGDNWSTSLSLLLYRPPLPAGDYTLSLAYQYGATAAETVVTNSVSFSVRSAEFLSASYRWMGGSNAWDKLESIWRVPGKWFYQVANTKNPAAIWSVVELDIPAASAPYSPVLPMINDLPRNPF